MNQFHLTSRFPLLRRHRRGIASTLAMLYLVLFSALAVGFFAAFTLGTQTAYNEREARRALAAAESGMEFIRYQLWSLDIAHDTAPEELFDQVYAQLADRLNGSSNLNGGNILLDGDAIHIPGDPNELIKTNSDGDGFRILLSRSGKEVIVSATGTTGSATSSALERGIRMNYGIYERPRSVFDFGVASKSAIEMIGNTAILGWPDPASGSVLSTASTDYPLTMGSNCQISGEVSFSNPDAWVQAGANAVINNEVGAANWSDNIHHVSEPDFPVVDTSDYLPYATTAITSSNPAGTQFVNIIIPPNTNPTFPADTEIFGVVYIQGPNKVTFAGTTTIKGIIVAENDAAGNWATDNQIVFRGTVTAEGVETLPAADPRFAGLTDLGGAFILAENFRVDFAGTATAGATNIAGSIVASDVSFSGTADANVTGTVINLEESSAVHFSGKSTVKITSSGTKSQPHGLYFGSHYVPLPGSYQETLEK